MKQSASIALAAMTAIALGSPAFASMPVPEIGGTGSLAALVIVGGIAAVILERRRRK
ncbi:MAG: hypothetical protein AAFN27_15030 [Pseudomonadota bacterium]